MRKGFTLIELLVVIAIIAILASILFPVFSRAREKARQSSCLSNTKQLTLGINMYAQDYDEQLPYAGLDVSGDGSWGAGDTSWRTVVLPYCRNAQIYLCPSDRNPTGTKFNGALLDGDQVGGYAMNYAHYNAGAPTPPSGQSLGAAEDASSVALLVESTGIWWLGVDGNSHGWVRSDKAATRHNGLQNVGYLDGHAKAQKPSVLCPTSGDCLYSLEME